MLARLKSRYTGILFSFILTACGGGSSPAGFVEDQIPTTPQLTIYKNFDLSDASVSATTLSFGQLLGCPTGGSQIKLQKNVSKVSTGPNNTVSFGYTVIATLNGNFTLPNGGQLSCNTTGMTGTIREEILSDLSGNIIFIMTGLNQPADAMQYGWQAYWRGILGQTGKVNVVQASSAAITCTNGLGSQYTLQPIPAGDLSSFVASCLK